MQTVQEYIESTETAIRQLFDGLGHYQKILKDINKPMFVTDCFNSGFSEEYDDWFKANRAEIAKSFKREQE